MNFIKTHAAWLAGALCGLALIGFGAALEGYSHALHPVGLLGARGVVRAHAFNLLGFVLPGLLAAWVAVKARAPLPAGARWLPRIGTWLLLLSALAFAAQGLLSLDPDDLDAPASRRHALCWMLWWVAFVSGAGLLAVGWWRTAHMRSAMVLLACGVVVLATTLLVAGPWPQRLALLAWFGAYIALERVSRD